MSRLGHFGTRMAEILTRRRRTLRLVKNMSEVDGTVRVIRPIIAPLSGRGVAACRLVIEHELDDGCWRVILDETKLGEIELLHKGVRTPIDNPAVLVTPGGTLFDGQAVRARFRRRFDADHRNLRATEYILVDGETVYLFGVSPAALQTRWEAPYRASPPSLMREPGVVVVISRWTRAVFTSETAQAPHLLPPW